jgi:hypothetical protein
MLSWPPGRRATDGVWAPAWYHAVERSTGFSAAEHKPAPPLPIHLARLEEQARPHYEALARFRL